MKTQIYFLLLVCSAFFLQGILRAQGTNSYPFQNPTLSIEERVDDLVSRMTLEEKVGQMQNEAPAIPRLGIPAYNWWNEGLHGVARAGIATVFPQAIGMAATWDPDLVHSEADVISTEARAKHNEAVRNNKYDIYEGLTFWSPNINIFRDPRWGRGQETYGEDPFLTGRMGVAFVKGLQGNDPKYLKVISTPKHFAVHSGPEPLRHTFDANISLRDLYETYLPAFEACVREGKAGSVMGAYNRLFGVACCASPLLLQDILRTKWGFDGYVVTDCGALWDMFMTHKIVKTAEEASALALKAGTDITCGDEYGSLVQAVKDSMVTEKEIDRSIRRLMTARFKLGMFDPPENVPYAQIPFSQNDTEVHSKLARKVAQESIVLLKNEHNTLPLKKELHSIAVIGPYADNEDVLLGNYHGTPSHPITILQGIRNAVGNSVNVGYCLGVPPLEDTVAMKHENASQINSAVQLCKKSDVAIVVAGISPLLEGEEMPVDLEGFKGGDRTTLELPANQEKLLKAISNTGTPIVLVLTNGSALAINWENENIPAIIDAWYPGQQGGNAVADVLFGEYNPAGRLPVTFYKSVNDLPPFEDYNMEGRTYRYFKSSPLYPFGYGLSYTQFEYKTIAVDKPQYSAEDTIHAAVTIANTGNYDGDEVIQCYLRSVDSKLHQPIKSLKGFTRVYFKQGESITVQIPIAVQSFRYFDETKNDYVVEPGTYELQIGASSSDIRLKTNIKIVE